MQQYHLWDHRLLLGEKRPVNSLGEADMGGMEIKSFFLHLLQEQEQVRR